MGRPSSDPLEIWRSPPIYELSSAGRLLEGSHTHKVWRSMTHPFGSVDVGRPMMVKWLSDKQVPLAIELACSMAAQALRLSVPAGAVVICAADQLPGLPRRFAEAGGYILCFGSALQFPDDSLARMIRDDSSVAEYTWRELCASPQGPSGAAWDELTANRDRHHENVVFDGANWWLIDHEHTLEPIAQVFRRWTQASARQAVLEYQASSNRLSAELVRRRPNDHGLDKQAKSLQALRVRLAWMADQVRNWRTGHARLDGVFEITEVVLRSLDSRLPALPLYVQRRLSMPIASSLWNSSSPE